MKRREVLAGLGVGAGSLAGCAGVAREVGSPTSSSPSRTPHPLARLGYPPDVCEQGLLDVGIDAIDEPAFAADWSGVEVGSRYADDGHLADDAVVIGLEHEGTARAYPVTVLWHHEVVNDAFGGPVLVTFCSLCRSGMVASRVVDGAPATFDVSGQLWVPPELATRQSEASGRAFAVERGDAEPSRVRNTGNLVLYDRRSLSYWSQLLARGICGRYAGTRLAIRPSTAATWADWRAAHPATDVLLPPPHSGLGRSPV